MVHSVEEALDAVKDYAPEDVYVIGGESIYRQFLPYCDTVHVTEIDRAYEADAYFPDLAKSDEWARTAEGEEQTYFDTAYTFVKYERKKNAE